MEKDLNLKSMLNLYFDRVLFDLGRSNLFGE